MTEIYKKAIEQYGVESQIIMMHEEMAELQKELCKNFRGKDNVADIAEEIADVQIMLEQMILIFDCRQSVEMCKRYKLKRLAERILENAQ